MVRNVLLLATSVALWATAASASGLNIVQNGGFETGDLSGWSYSEWNVAGVNADVGAPTDTSYVATTFCIFGFSGGCNNASNGADISQSLATAAGQSYTLTFDYEPRSNGLFGPQGAELDVFWSGSSTPSYIVSGRNTGTWSQYTVPDLVATGSSTVLEFTGGDSSGSVVLTDISVTADAGSASPEPLPFTLVGSGLLGMIGSALRRWRIA